MLIGIDVGTQVCKSVIFKEDGEIISEANKSYSLTYIKPRWIEQDANIWWEAVKTTLREAFKKSKISQSDIRGISVSTQANTPVPVDKEGNPLCPAISWLDTRSNDQVKMLREKMDEDFIYKTTGLNLAPGFTLPKILWMKQNRPSIFSKAYKFMLAEDFIIYKLTGVSAIDFSLISFSLLFDINRIDWAYEILESTDLTADKFSNPCPSGNIVGEVTEKASRETGLKKGTPVIAGGHDQCCAAIGTGVIRPGIALNSIGTAQAMICVLNRPLFDPSKHLLCYLHAMPEKRWILLGTLSSAGILLRWFRDNFCTSEIDTARNMDIDPYNLLDKEAETVKPCSHGLLIQPYFNDAKGVIFGLSLYHEKRHIIRAILESIGFETRRILEYMERLGVHVTEIRMAGGGAKSPLWRQIISDQTNKTVLLPKTLEAASLGAAILAGVGTGTYKDIYEGVNKTVKIVESRDPIPDNINKYKKYYKKYCKLSQTLSKAFENSPTRFGTKKHYK